MTSVVRIAIHKPTGEFLHIDNATNGLSCNCECLKCGEKLEAIQGEIRTKHFRHYSNKDCQGSQETALHELGKQILLRHDQIHLPKIGLITYSDPKAEQRCEKIRPDVTAIYREQTIFFEIFVSHLVDDRKDKFIKEKQIKCVEIDLSSELNSTYEEIRKKVLEDIHNKRIVFWEQEILNKSDTSNTLFLGGIFSLAIVVGLAWLFRRS